MEPPATLHADFDLQNLVAVNASASGSQPSAITPGAWVSETFIAHCDVVGRPGIPPAQDRGQDDGRRTVRLRLPGLVGPEPDPAVRAVTKRLALGAAATA